jgi:hypothetical protein
MVISLPLQHRRDVETAAHRRHVQRDHHHRQPVDSTTFAALVTLYLLKALQIDPSLRPKPSSVALSTCIIGQYF